ncbi:MAG: MATE family efflux transporter [Clostridium sp.]|nr:MATE family efflux transporter [Bacteroides sp.]MCM1198710.1 MATE family efflux transporter [Clostridium sp.]
MIRKGIVDMTEGTLWDKIIVYTVPIILTGLLQLLFNAADLIVVGRFCGSISLAAVGATGSLTSLIVNFFIGLSIGAGVGVARGIGARRDPQVQDIVHTAIPTAIASGLLLTAIGEAFAPDFLEMMGTPENVIGLSTSYMRFFFSGMTFMMVFNFGASILRAVGDTSSPLMYLSIAGVFNVLLNLIFVTRFDMGVNGVGLATALSQAVAAGLVVRELTQRRDACRLVLSRMKFHREALGQIFSIGLPAGIQSSLFAISNVVIQSSVNSFGYIAMTGNAAAANIESFEYVCMNSFQQTSMNFVGQNAGAGKFRRVRSINRLCLLYVTIVGAVMSGLIYYFGRTLLGIYITDSAEAVGAGIIRMSFICLPYFLCGIMDTTTGSLRGLGYSTLPMVTAILGVVIMRIGWIMTVFRIPEFHTLSGLYVSYPISWIVTFAAQAILFAVVLRKQAGKGSAAV